VAKTIALLVIGVILVTSCAAADPVGYKYIIYAPGSDDYYYCKRLDVEKRVGYDCLDVYNRGLIEYHLGIADGWAVR